MPFKVKYKKYMVFRKSSQIFKSLNKLYFIFIKKLALFINNEIKKI